MTEQNHGLEKQDQLVYGSLGAIQPSLDENQDDKVVKREILLEAYYNLAKLYYDKSDLRKAKEYFEKCLELCKLPSENFTKFKILGFLVRVNSEMMNQEDAKTFINSSLELGDKMGQELGSLTSEYFYYLATVDNYVGEFTRARDNFHLAMGKAREENEPTVLAKSLYSLANLCYQAREYQEALNYLNQLQDLLQIIQKTYMLGTMHLLFANVYSSIEQFSKSLEHFQMATTCFQKKFCWNLMGYVLLGQGNLFKKMGEFNRANWYLNQSIHMVNTNVFKRLSNLLRQELADLNDSNVDLYLDRTNRMIYEKTLGPIDFKHRFVLLEILFLLAQNSGKYFDKDKLAKLIWKDEYNPLIHDKLIYTSVSRLRKLIEPKGEKRKYIIRGKDGYTFNPSIKARFQRDTKLGEAKSIGNVNLSSPV